MLIANRTFIANHDGERIEIVAGQTALDPTHPLARQYPDAFEQAPEPALNGRARDRMLERSARPRA